MPRFALRSHYWGALLMVVVIGEVDAAAAAVLNARLAELQRGSSVLVDLWDATVMDDAAVHALVAAKRRAQEAGWEFGVVVDPEGPCAEVIRAADPEHELQTFPTRHDARAALQAASS